MTVENNKTIWIDLDNSPHVPFFNPIVKELNKYGYKIIITARDCFQVIGLCKYFGLEYKKNGKHWGRHLVLKVLGTIYRSISLLVYVWKYKPDIAVAHGSRSMLLAAKVLRIRTVVFDDYEYSNKTLVSDYIVVPKVLFKVMSEKRVDNNKSKLLFYNGIKEDIYVPFFKPDPNIPNALGVTQNQILVMIRPPATEAHYHNPESEKIFTTVIDYLSENDAVRMVILPRSQNQKKQVQKQYYSLIKKKYLIIPEQVYDGLNIIWHSDLVISGGGTMNREAAALNVPVYSIFRGSIGAVDKYLCSINRLTLIESPGDVRRKIIIKKHTKTSIENSEKNLPINEIVTIISNILNSSELISVPVS
ncbi:MAG TPA: DUF354 domain-containing protein [Chitinispirillaceae bacterium]|nr:DUF354 domain-containing protein [Chitinispirillaceae bacterium]